VLGDLRGEIPALSNLGAAYYKTGNIKRAADFYSQALKLAYDIEDRFAACTIVGNLGNIYYVIGNFQTAVTLYEPCYSFSCDLGDQAGQGTVLFNKSLALNKLGKHKDSIIDAKSISKI
jgi:tetratricopeptide (TPR) repeat protein